MVPSAIPPWTRPAAEGARRRGGARVEPDHDGAVGPARARMDVGLEDVVDVGDVELVAELGAVLVRLEGGLPLGVRLARRHLLGAVQVGPEVLAAGGQRGAGGQEAGRRDQPECPSLPHRDTSPPPRRRLPVPLRASTAEVRMTASFGLPRPAEQRRPPTPAGRAGGVGRGRDLPDGDRGARRGELARLAMLAGWPVPRSAPGAPRRRGHLPWPTSAPRPPTVGQQRWPPARSRPLGAAPAGHLGQLGQPAPPRARPGPRAGRAAAGPGGACAPRGRSSRRPARRGRALRAPPQGGRPAPGPGLGALGPRRPRRL